MGAAAHPNLQGPSHRLKPLPWVPGQQRPSVWEAGKGPIALPQTHRSKRCSPLSRAGGMELLALARVSRVRVKERDHRPPSEMCAPASVTGVHSPKRDLCCPAPPPNPGSEHRGFLRILWVGRFDQTFLELWRWLVKALRGFSSCQKLGQAT